MSLSFLLISYYIFPFVFISFHYFEEIVITFSFGIGRETALDLAKRGGTIYIACRNLTKAEAAKQDIKNQSGNNNVFTMKLDLASFESIREFADE